MTQKSFAVFQILVALALAASATLLAAPQKTEAAVAFDAVGPSSAGAGGQNIAHGSPAVSWSHTTSGSDRLLIVGIALGIVGGGGAPTLAVTYNDVPMTLAVSRYHVIAGDDDTGSSGFIEIYYLVAPTTGSNTVAINMTGTDPGQVDISAGSVSFTGVDQSNPIAHNNTNRGSGTSASVTVTSAVGNMVVDILGAGGNPIGTPGAGIDARWEKDINGSSAAGNGAQSTDDGAASVTMSYSTTADVWGIIALDLGAAAPGRIIRLRGRVQIWGGTNFR